MSELTLNLGSLAPGFSLPNDSGSQTTLNELKGRWVVVYFYPKDNTSGCTLEALEFTSLAPQFEAAGATILGISPDSIKSHCKFRDAHNLSVVLLSDPESQVISAFGAWKMKGMYGRQYMGVERTTALVAPDGSLAHLWTRVKAAGHAQEVLQKIIELKR